MSTFRILSQAPVYFDTAGKPLSGGYLKFYATGTTTAKDVYSDADKSSNLGSTVSLDSDGRTESDVWGDGEYRVRLYASDDTLIAESDDVQLPGGAGSSIPALSSGKFLTNNGSVLQWAEIRQLPDPTGSSGKVLSTDGTNFTWIDKPADGSDGTSPDTSSTSTSATIAGFLIQTGSATAAASGSDSTSKAVTFGVEYDSAALFVGITPTTVSQNGPCQVTWNLTAAPTKSGFTVAFDVSEGNSGDSKVNNDVPFDWVAFGIKAAE